MLSEKEVQGRWPKYSIKMLSAFGNGNLCLFANCFSVGKKVEVQLQPDKYSV